MKDLKKRIKAAQLEIQEESAKIEQETIDLEIRRFNLRCAQDARLNLKIDLEEARKAAKLII